MAGMHGSAVSFIVPRNQFSFCRTTPLLSVSASISASFSSKLTRRKNHLRIKIVKTLTKPYPLTSAPILPQLPPSEPATHIVSPDISRPSHVETELASSTADGDEVEVSRFSESSNPATQFNFDFGNFSWGSVLRFGVYFVAVFAFQTICAVCVLEYGNWIKEERDSDRGSDVFRASRGEVLLNGDGKSVHGNLSSKTSQLVYSDESKMREKIEEIRLMAREARKKEKGNLSDDFGGEGPEDGEVISKARAGIEKEVDARLVKLQKRLNSSRDKESESHVNYLLKSEKVVNAIENDSLNGDKGNKSLTFKKMFKYRNSSNESMTKPVGFQGFASKRRKSGSNGKGMKAEDGNSIGDNMEVSDPKKMLKDDGTNLASFESVLKPKSGRKKLDMGTDETKTSTSNGVIQESSSVEILKSKNSRDLDVRNSQETFATSAAPPMVNSNGTDVAKKSMAYEGRSKQSNKGPDLWWSKLPYVLVVFMRRGSDDGLGGLFTLKIPSGEREYEDSTYTVAFEDRVDANNFCYLLESFFEDLGDFAADIVPLPANELKNAVKPHVNNIVVVKKGQLQLYAGQPFGDVEMALLDLVKQNESVISLNPR